MPVPDFDWDAWNKDGKTVLAGLEMVPEIIAKNGGSMARDILRKQIELKGVSKRTAYRRIDEAEKSELIKFNKGKNVFVVA